MGLRLFLLERILLRGWFDEIDLVILRVINLEEEVLDFVDIAGGLTDLLSRGTWQVLGLHHGLPYQLEPILHSLEEKCVVSERHKEIVAKCSIFDTKPLLGDVVN